MKVIPISEAPVSADLRQSRQLADLLRWQARELCRQCRHLTGCLVMQELELRKRAQAKKFTAQEKKSA